jgi:hypothetical protein
VIEIDHFWLPAKDMDGWWPLEVIEKNGGGDRNRTDE